MAVAPWIVPSLRQAFSPRKFVQRHEPNAGAVGVDQPGSGETWERAVADDVIVAVGEPQYVDVTVEGVGGESMRDVAEGEIRGLLAVGIAVEVAVVSVRG